jgi:Flp pilus assembly protein TadD
MKRMTCSKHLVIVLLLSSVLLGCQTSPTKPVGSETADLGAQLDLAHRLLAQGKHEAALAEYHLALEMDPKNTLALSRLAYLYDRLGDATATEYVLRDLLALQPENVEALERLGLLELKRGQRESAKERFVQAEALGRTSWQLLNGLGVLADYAGDYPLAQEYYARALQQNPTDRGLLLNNIGYSHYLEGDLEGALAWFNKALTVDPTIEEALSNKGLALIRMGRSADAYAVFKNFMSDEKALNNVGFLNMLFNNYRLAEQYFRMAVKASPVYYKEAHDNLQHLQQLQRKGGVYQLPS